MTKKILICVDGGVATVIDDTVPKGYEVEIIDYDNLRENEQETLKHLSTEACQFIALNP